MVNIDNCPTTRPQQLDLSMNPDSNYESSDTDMEEEVERLKRKYLERRNQLSPTADTREVGHTHSAGALPKTLQPPRCKEMAERMKDYNKALQELFMAVTNPPDRLGIGPYISGSDDNLSEDDTIRPFQDPQAPCTETDVTLPSCLDETLGSRDTESTEGVAKTDCGRVQCPSSPAHSPLSVPGKVYVEMMAIYEQLKAERASQQQWERRLEERERRLEQKEQALGRLTGMEDMVRTHMEDHQQKHQEEVSRLQELLVERSRENRRLKSSFNSMKELNDSMKKQLNELSEQNKRLEGQYKKTQARLDNLQRKCEHTVALKGRGNVCLKNSEPSRKTAASGKASNKIHQGSSSPASAKLLALLLDWVLDGQAFSPVAGDGGTSLDLSLPPAVVLNERCSKALPLLAEQLQLTPSSEPGLLLNLLRLVHWAIRHMDTSAQPVALSSTLRRIGEELSKPQAGVQLTTPDTQDPDFTQKPCRPPHRTIPLYRSPCPHTRILSTLITLRTITQADIVAQVLDSLHSDLLCDETRGLFLRYRGVCVLLSLLRAGRGGLNTPIDILMQLTEQSHRPPPETWVCNMSACLKKLLVCHLHQLQKPLEWTS